MNVDWLVSGNCVPMIPDNEEGVVPIDPDMRVHQVYQYINLAGSFIHLNFLLM